jgi:hypothetical protein
MRLIEILDTAVKIGLGALIGVVGALCLEAHRSRQQRVREAEQRYRDNIEKPVVGFVDELLTLMSRAYWNKADGKGPEIDSLLVALREKEAPIEAKLKAMGRPDVEKHFSALDRCYGLFRTELPRAPGGPAFDLKKEAQAHAAGLFGALYGWPLRRSREATASLILGLFSSVATLGLLAVIFGHLAEAPIPRSAGRLPGEGIAAAGLVIAGSLAAIFGHFALASIRRSGGRLLGEGMAAAGLVLGYLSLGVWAIYALSLLAR